MTGVNNGQQPTRSSAMSASLPSLFRTNGSALIQQQQPVIQQQHQRRRSQPERHLVSTQVQTEQRNNNESEENETIQPEEELHIPPARRQRRREKRRRRGAAGVAQQPLQQHVQQMALDAAAAQHCQQTDLGLSDGGEHLPDILNAHMPPPYSTLPHNSERCMGMGPLPGPLNLGMAPPTIPGILPVGGIPITSPLAATTSTSPALMASNSFNLPPPGGRRSRGSMYGGEQLGHNESGSGVGKSCCGVMVTQTVSIRWFIVMIAFVGICCAVVGTVLGAMRSSGREHLTVSLLMIGVGIVLITVSGIAWRLTSQDAPSCRAMLGMAGSTLAGGGGLHGGSSPVGLAEVGECGGVGGAGEPGGGGAGGRRFLSRIPPTYGRPHHPYAAMMYPEFQYRPPPPSYQASMQEYRLRLLLLDRDRHQQQLQHQQAGQHGSHNGSSHSTPLSRACAAAVAVSGSNQHHSASSGVAAPVSPPPTYRSQANTLVRPSLPIRELNAASSVLTCASRPPSYRSRSSASNAIIANNNSHNTMLAGNTSDGRPASPDIDDQEPISCEPLMMMDSLASHQSSSGTSSCTQVLIHADAVEAKLMMSDFDVRATVDSVEQQQQPLQKRDKDDNTVTIVQTNSSSQVLASGFHRNVSPILVTVTSPAVHHQSGGSSPAHSSTHSSQNLQVLAQL